MIISVIIPVYKVEKYIQRCLESVIAQKCNGFDIECILVDDCSPDMSMDIAKGIIAHYIGPISFRIITNSENQGLSCSRNNGLRIAKGEFVFFLDSDDNLMANSLSFLYREIKRYGCVIDMVVGNSYDYDLNRYWLDKNGSPFLLLNHDDIMRRFLQIEMPMMAWNKLVRRQFLLDNNLFFRPSMIHEDELWSYDLYEVVRSVVLIPEVTYLYESHAESITSSSAFFTHRVEGCHILVSKMLITLKQGLYVERFFWGINIYMRSEALIRDGGLVGEVVLTNKKLCRLMLYRSLADFRLSIFVFLLLTVHPPFCNLIRFRWFRQKYNWVRNVFSMVALAFDSFHPVKKNQRLQID